MGYYTYHNLYIIDNPTDLSDSAIIAHLRDYADDARYALEEDGQGYDSCKWYSHDEDMRDFSRLHPDVLFELDGEGDESGDIWQAYFQNGKAQYCQAKVTFEKYDPKKME